MVFLGYMVRLAESYLIPLDSKVALIFSRSSVDEIKGGKPTPSLKNEDDKPIVDVASKIFPNLNETLEAVALDIDQNEIFKVPISEVVSKLSTQSEIKYLLLDGIITQRLIESAKNAGIEYVIGHRVAKLSNSNGMTLKTFSDLGLV